MRACGVLLHVAMGSVGLGLCLQGSLGPPDSSGLPSWWVSHTISVMSLLFTFVSLNDCEGVSHTFYLLCGLTGVLCGLPVLCFSCGVCSFVLICRSSLHVDTHPLLTSEATSTPLPDCHSPPQKSLRLLWSHPCFPFSF